MSAETDTYLNNNILKGFVEDTGSAWWRDDTLLEGTEPSHYTGPVPIEDVKRRLFHWLPISRRVAVEIPATVETMTHLSDDGQPMRWAVQTDRQAITRDDTHDALGLFKSGYRIHEYQQTLLKNVEALLDQGLRIGSAGLLRRGAQAWVQVEMPETLRGPGGVEHRPYLTAATSLDGSLATTYLTGSTLVVCDNTLSAALGDALAKIKIRHSARSEGRVAKIRDALGLVARVGEEFEAQVQAMIDTEFDDKAWARFLDAQASLTDKGEPKTGRALTMAVKHRDQLNNLWNNDRRVMPWRGTLFGAVQAVNTWEHHLQTVKGGQSRVARNMSRMVTGEWDKIDARTTKTALKVLSLS